MPRLRHFVLIAVVCVAGLAGAQQRPVAGGATVQPRAVVARGPLSADERNTIGVFESVSPSVVYITTVQYVRDFFSPNVMRLPQGTGSGFVWDEQGRVVTNYHVIRGAQEAQVRLSDQRSFRAQLVGFSADHDIAVLQIDVPTALPPPIPIGSSGDLRVGQTVLAIGNPFGLDHTLTTGMVRALGRELGSPTGRTIHDVIQTDAAINPGNSGGPLLNSSGKLIGVNSAIYSPSGASAGVGFAVPVDTVRRLVPQLIEHGKPIEPEIGVVWLADSVAARLGLAGAVVYEVARHSPAERAGLRGIRMSRMDRVQLGDVVVAVEGRAVRSTDQLLHELESIGVGKPARLTVERDGKRREVSVELEPSN
jgi:S1-C subfamily serine protease